MAEEKSLSRASVIFHVALGVAAAAVLAASAVRSQSSGIAGYAVMAGGKAAQPAPKEGEKAGDVATGHAEVWRTARQAALNSLPSEEWGAVGRWEGFGDHALFHSNMARTGTIEIGEAAEGGPYRVSVPLCWKATGAAGRQLRVLRTVEVEVVERSGQFQAQGSPTPIEERALTFWRQLYAWLLAAFVGPVLIYLAVAVGYVVLRLLLLVFLLLGSSGSGVTAALVFGHVIHSFQCGVLTGAVAVLLLSLPNAAYSGWVSFNSYLAAGAGVLAFLLPLICPWFVVADSRWARSVGWAAVLCDLAIIVYLILGCCGLF